LQRGRRKKGASTVTWDGLCDERQERCVGAAVRWKGIGKSVTDRRAGTLIWLVGVSWPLVAVAGTGKRAHLVKSGAASPWVRSSKSRRSNVRSEDCQSLTRGGSTRSWRGRRALPVLDERRQRKQGARPVSLERATGDCEQLKRTQGQQMRTGGKKDLLSALAA
jgi:hypothetical protein